MRVAAIDIGSNSIRLLVADITRDARGTTRIRTVTRAGEPCRLGRGLDRSGRVEPEMAERAAALAAEFADRARGLGAVHVVVGATAALRIAADGPEVAQRIAAKVRVPVRILSGDDEARLVYRSVVSGLGGVVVRGSCIVFDIGGGSTEVVSGVGDQPGRWSSLPFGAVSLTERFITSNPPFQKEIDALREEVGRHLMHHCAMMPPRVPMLVGVGGTITVLALIDRGLAHYEPGLIEGWTIERERLRALVGRLLASTPEERRRLPAMGSGRADIVVAGALVVESLAERFPAPGLVCSTQGLRYALARLAAEEASEPGGDGRTGDRVHG